MTVATKVAAPELTWVYSFDVAGDPVAQGSKRIGRNRRTGRPILLDDNDSDLRSWRELVHLAGIRERRGQQPLEGPIEVRLVFRLSRPKDHFGSGGNAGQLKPNAPRWHPFRKDADKVARSVLDALKTARIYGDDGQVAHLDVSKVWAARDESPGVAVAVGVLQP